MSTDFAEMTYCQVQNVISAMYIFSFWLYLLYIWLCYFLVTIYWTSAIISLSVTILNVDHCLRSVRIQSFSGPYFPAFGLNTERYSLCGKIRTSKNPNTDTFSGSKYYVSSEYSVHAQQCIYQFFFTFRPQPSKFFSKKLLIFS